MIKEIIVVEGKDDTAAIKTGCRGGDDRDGRLSNRSELYSGGSSWLSSAEASSSSRIPTMRANGFARSSRSACPAASMLFCRRRRRPTKGILAWRMRRLKRYGRRLPMCGQRRYEDDAAGGDTMEDLMRAGLLVHPQCGAAGVRAWANLLGIGYANGKQFYKRCSMFRITRKEFRCVALSRQM